MHWNHLLQLTDAPVDVLRLQQVDLATHAIVWGWLGPEDPAHGCAGPWHRLADLRQLFRMLPRQTESSVTSARFRNAAPRLRDLRLATIWQAPEGGEEGAVVGPQDVVGHDVITLPVPVSL